MSFKDDFLMVLRDNKGFILFATLLIIFTPLFSDLWKEYRFYLDQKIFYDDPLLTVIQGEDVTSSNGHYWIRGKDRSFGGQFAVSFLDDLPKEGYIFFKYEMHIKTSGAYKIFFAGFPAGAKEKGIYESYCPYEVFIDGKKVSDMYEESYTEFLKEKTKSLFYKTYSYAPLFAITKLGEFHLTEGVHEIEFRVSRKSLKESKYKYEADGIFVVPLNWKPERLPFTLPADIFSY